MPYILDENDNHILDENGDKIEFSVSYIDTDDWYKHREGIHINDDGHLDTEDRHLIVKDAVSQNHAVSKNQLDQLNNNINNKITKLQDSIAKSITNQFKIHETAILTQMLAFRNEQVKNRIQRKYLKIPKKINTWIKLFDYTDVDNDTIDLKNVIVLNIWIKRFDRFHNAKSALLEKDFGNSIEFFYNSDMTGYYTYFSTVPNNWSMETIVEWLKLPKIISIENENIPESKPESKPENLNSNE